MSENNHLFSSNLKMWLAIFILAISTFTIVTAELAPIGLLTPMAESLNQSESMIGLTVTLYAWIGAISALLSSIFLGNVSKKRLLLGLILILLVSNILSALASSYALLLAARVIGALSHGAFWAMIGALAMSLVPARQLGLATSIVFAGVSAASVFGVPLANFIGSQWTWQSAFWLISLLSVLSLVGILWLVPSVKANSELGVSALKQVITDPLLLKIYAATFIAITAHFTAFTFIEPYLQTSDSVSNTMIAMMLFTFGCAGLLGNFITGAFIDKYLKRLIAVAIVAIACVLVTLGIGAQALTQTAIVLLISVWGLATSSVFVGFQTWVLKTAQHRAFPASAVYVSIFNAAIGSGALLGAWLVSQFSFAVLMIYSGVAIACSLVLLALAATNAARVETLPEGESV